MAKEMQIKTTMRYCVTPSRVAKVRLLDNTRFWKGYGAISTSFTVGENLNWVTIMDCLRICLINLFSKRKKDSMQFMRRYVGDYNIMACKSQTLSHHMPTSVYVCMSFYL